MTGHPRSDDLKHSSDHGDWQLTPVGEGSWRICDLSRRYADADCLVAYLERTANGWLDVLWLSTPRPTATRFRNFGVLFDALELARANVSDRSRSPLTIVHRPPL